MRKQPLIRKKYTVLSIVKLIFSRILGGGKKAELRIPSFSDTAQFVSFASPDEKARLPERMDLPEFLQLLRHNGINGLGGASFPVVQKLNTVLQSKREHPVLLVNAVECDPGLHHDLWILDNRRRELEDTLAFLKKNLGLSHIYLARKKSSEPLFMKGIDIVEIPDFYPAGEERQLVDYILGTGIDSSSYPAEQGIWVQNIQTILSLYFLLSRQPALRYLTAVNLDSNESTVVECSSRIEIGEISSKLFPQYDKIYGGGGIMQAASIRQEQILDESINMIAVGRPGEFTEENCSHCGQCKTHCSAGLDVEKLVELKLRGEAISESDRKLCRRCGACSYLCPAGRDLCSHLHT